MIRPQDPITFIANFMLMNKSTLRNLEDILKELPREPVVQEPIVGDEEENFDQEENNNNPSNQLSKQVSILGQQQQPQSNSQKKNEKVDVPTGKKEEAKPDQAITTKGKTKIAGK